MRTIIDVPDEDVLVLDVLASKRRVSRASLIRDAIQMLLAQEKPETSLNAFAGLWKGREIDGLAFQEQVRAEW